MPFLLDEIIKNLMKMAEQTVRLHRKYEVFDQELFWPKWNVELLNAAIDANTFSLNSPISNLCALLIGFE